MVRVECRHDSFRDLGGGFVMAEEFYVWDLEKMNEYIEIAEDSGYECEVKYVGFPFPRRHLEFIPVDDPKKPPFVNV